MRVYHDCNSIDDACLYGNGDVIRQSVIHPTPAMCEAHKQGLAIMVREQGEELKAQGVEKVQIMCVNQKDA